MGRNISKFVGTVILASLIPISAKENVTSNYDSQTTNTNPTTQHVISPKRTYLEPRLATTCIKTPVVNERFTKIIYDIESGGDSIAISEKGAMGSAQLKDIVRKEWNQHHPEEQYSPEDLLKKSVSEKIGSWYLRRIENHYLPVYNLSQTPENIITAYNWGVKKLRKLGRDVKGPNDQGIPEETRKFIEKFRNRS